MHTGEPDLLELLALRPPGRRLLPQRRHEVLAMLVERERMKGVLDVLAKAGIQETIILLEQAEPVEVFRNAQRADSVPNADAFDRCILLARLEARKRLGVLFLVRFPQRPELIEVTL